MSSISSSEWDSKQCGTEGGTQQVPYWFHPELLRPWTFHFPFGYLAISAYEDASELSRDT
jgi:hypothetical protein